MAHRFDSRAALASYAARAFVLASALWLHGCLARTVVVGDGGGGGGGNTGVLCNGTRCAAGQDCCFASGQCFDPSITGACALAGGPFGGGDGGANEPPPDAPAPGTLPIGAACTANSQCAPEAFCEGSFCLGPGVCHARANTPTCGAGPGDPTACQVCGCDGVTYPGPEALYHAGVRGAGAGACGAGPSTTGPRDGGTTSSPTRIACGTSDQCPAGSACCGITGQCYDPAACPGCCSLPPEGTNYPCVSNAQCRAEYGEFCSGPPGCGTPGGCTRPTEFHCTDEVATVCGCDGRTYRNAGCAGAGSARVSHAGACACTSNADCVTGQYCAGDGCGTAGTCVDVPPTCDGEIDPVCGCNGRSYQNARCAAVGATRVAAHGQCP